MKALVKYDCGPGNAAVMDTQRPQPGPGEVLIKVMGAGICGTDLHILTDSSYPVKPPVTLGHEVSGTVEEAGPGVTGWSVGEKVVCETYYHTCGSCFFCKTGSINLCEEKLSIGSGVNGAMAEYVKVPAKNLHRFPESLSFEEACMTEPLVCCVQAVFQHSQLLPEDYVVVTGPGTIGLLTLQVIRLFGCRTVVLGTKNDRQRLDMALQLGADKVMYVEDEDITGKVKTFCRGIGADAVFECSGAVSAIQLSMDFMRKGACHIQVGIPSREASLDMGKVVLREYQIKGTYATRPIWWDKTMELLHAKKISLKPLLSSAYPLLEWEKGFKKAIGGEGFKHIIVPCLVQNQERSVNT